MPLHQTEIRVKTHGECDVIDLTHEVQDAVAAAGGKEGMLHLFVSGSTAGLTTIEFESGCVKDLKEAMERVAPRDAFYHHNERWGDGNGFSHVRAALLGPSLSVPLVDGRPALGTWQQIVLVCFDNRARNRCVVVTVITGS